MNVTSLLRTLRFNLDALSCILGCMKRLLFLPKCSVLWWLQIWCRAIEHTLQCGQDGAGEAARKLLERALSALPLRKHTKVITSTALLEFRHGSAERGRSMFEGVLRNYPKRLDLWGVYVDQVGVHPG